MEREFYEEWRRLEDEAVAFLERRPTRKGLLTECHAVILPSFGDCIAYSLMVPFGQKMKPTGMKRTWRRRQDFERFESPVTRLRHGTKLVPTVEEQEVPLLATAVEEILARASGLLVPARVALTSVGTDGVSYILQFGEHFLSTEFHWSNEAPAGWAELDAVLRQVSSVVESGLT